MTMREGYAQWEPRYDEPGDELLDVEEPVVHEILDALPVGGRRNGLWDQTRREHYSESTNSSVVPSG
jgi:hypothetical protein